MTLRIPGEYPPHKVDQTFTSDRDGFGNCLQACVATLFSIPLDTVVDLRPTRITHEESQLSRLDRWLKKYGWAVYHSQSPFPGRGYYIVSGFVSRSIYLRHAVVMHNGTLYHDPHPSREGLCVVTHMHLFYPLPKGGYRGMDPARAKTVFQFHPSPP